MTTKGQKFNRPKYKTLYLAMRDSANTDHHNFSAIRDHLAKAQAAGKFWLAAALCGWALAVVLGGVLVVR